MANPVVSKKSIEDANWVMPVLTNDSESEASRKLGDLVVECEKAGNKALADSIRVIASALGMVLQPFDLKGPFVPLHVWGNERTAIMSDFDDNFLEVLEQALQSSSVPRIRARLADILWLRKKNVSFANIAIESYLQAVRHILAQRLEHKNRCPSYLIRVSQIAKQLNASDEVANSIRKIFIECINANGTGTTDDIRLRFFQAYLHSGFLNDFEYWINFANSESEKMVTKRDFRPGQDYLECALNVAGFAKDQNKITQLNLKIAQFHETEAALLKETKVSALLIQHALESAIKQYRKIGGHKEKVEVLHKELIVIQQDVHKELGTFTLEVDRTEEITDLKRNVEEKSTIDALVYLAVFACPPSIELLKKEIKRAQDEVSIMDIIDKTIINEQGKTVARKSGVSPEEITSEQIDLKIAGFMAEHAESGGSAIHEARIDLAFRNEGEELFDPILVGHPLIPGNRLRLFRQGFHAGLLGDYVTATHILIPQFENSLRILFEKRGILTSSLDNQLIQKERDLNILLYKEEVWRLLDPRFVYMMRCLFVDNGNFNFRNYLAHGLVSDDWFNSPVAVYIWIFLFLFFYHGSQLQNKNKAKTGDV